MKIVFTLRDITYIPTIDIDTIKRRLSKYNDIYILCFGINDSNMIKIRKLFRGVVECERIINVSQSNTTDEYVSYYEESIGIDRVIEFREERKRENSSQASTILS